MKPKTKPLTAKMLRNRCDMRTLSFASTKELSPQEEFVGQKRAILALTLGMAIESDGFNIYALGPPGVGKRSVIRTLLASEAQKRPRPQDICYVYNFKEPRKPSLLLVNPGTGRKLEQDMRQLIEILKTSIPAIFEEKEFNLLIKKIQEESQARQEEALAKLEDEALKNGISILQTPQGFVLAAVKDGQVISQADFEALPKDEREKKEELMKELRGHLTEYLEQIPALNKALNKKIKEVFQHFTMLQVGGLIDDIVKKYQDQLKVVEYLNRVKQVILDNPNHFRRKSENKDLAEAEPIDRLLNRYLINVLVDNGNLSGAPIIYEDNPNFVNLVGKIDHLSQFGALVTDFTLLRAGALHRASGGFLLLDAYKLLTQPLAWDGLKRALRSKEVRMENIYQLLGYMSTLTLEPEALPLDIKIVLLGERQIYYLLAEHDPDFCELFKVAADFDEVIERNTANILLFAKLLKSLVEKSGLLPLKKDAVAMLVEHSSRLAGDAQKLSTHVRLLADLVQEANHYSKTLNKTMIDSSDIEQAIHEQRKRASRLVDLHHEHIEKGIILIETTGVKVGQINALSYLSLGGFAYGVPSKITASIAEGKGDVIDIEREVRLGGPIHSKGVLILSGFLRKLFAQKQPLSLSASLVFEQSYGGIEGDSASAAEACLLITAIADLPIKQSFGITGSINQHGQIQAVGGINEKIEGFFDICQERGLTGEQGVIIPKANVAHLMLRKDVVKAAHEKKFHIYAIEHIDEALELLTGVKAQSTRLVKNSIYEKAAHRLKSLAKTPKK